MADTYNPNDNAQLKHIAALAQVTKNQLDGKYGDAAIADGQLKFFAKAGDTTPLKTIDLPEELFLDQVRTTFVPTFTFSQATYPDATNPNLDGKPVLVLAVKGDKTTNPTLTYSFVNLENLVDTYGAMNAGISIAGYSIGAKLSATATNILSIAQDGLLGEMKVAGASAGHVASFGASGYIQDSGLSVADLDFSGKADKVAGASAGNIVTLDANGNIVDSGVTFASDTDVINMLNGIFGAGSISSI